MKMQVGSRHTPAPHFLILNHTLRQAMMKITKKPKTKKYTLTLSGQELLRLSQYAKCNGIDRPTALHRIVSQSLRKYSVTPMDSVDERQLGLFDTLQIDIFNNTAVVK